MANVAATTATSSLHQLWRHFFSRGQLPLNVSFNFLSCNFAQQQTFITSSSSCHAILVFIIPTLVNLIEVKFQGKSISPFETHPLTTMVGVTGLLVYCSAYSAEQTFSSSANNNSHTFCSTLMKISSSISLASLASILFPDSMRCIFYIIYTLLLLVEFRAIIYETYNYWSHQNIMDKILNVLRRPQYLHLRRRRPLLPQTLEDVHDTLRGN